MKKRILALALAGTTAFSVFGGLNVFADLAKSYEFKAVNEALTAASVTDPNGAGSYTYKAAGNALTQANFKADVALYDKLLAFLENNVYVDVDGDYFATPDAEEFKTGNVYLYDYTIDETAFENAVEDFLTVYGVATKVSELTTGWDTDGTANTDIDLTELKLGYEDGEAVIAALVEKGDALYDKLNGYTTAETGYGAVDSARREATDAFKEIQDEILPATDYEDAPDGYEALYKIFTETLKTTYTNQPTSYLAYLVAKYNEMADELYYADTTDVEDWIGLYMDVLDARSEADYKNASDYNRFYADYLDIQADYEDETSLGKLTAYRNELKALITASTGTSAGVDKTALKDAIDVAKEYEEDEYDKSDDWDYFEKILAEAEVVEGKSKTYSYQSTVDAYTELLTEAIALLDPDSASKDWAILRLETAVSDGLERVETDYSTSSWNKFSDLLDRGQSLLDASNTSTSMMTKVAGQLEAAMTYKTSDDGAANVTFSLSPKTVPATTKRELQNTLEEAKELLDSMTESASGNQLLGLSTAINDAEDLFSDADCKNLNKSDDNFALISQVEAATAALEEAMTLAQHPQGWYQDDKGTWFYGVGTENYTGWLELNGRTYFLKDDGSMAANTWVKTDAGYWYYLNASGAMMHDGWAKINDTWYYFKNFGGMAEGWVKDGNTWYYLQPGSGKMVTGWNLINGKYYYFDASGAMLANTTTPDGYKVDASGAWVK